MGVEQSDSAAVRTIEDLVNSLTQAQLTLLERVIWAPQESPYHHHLKVVAYNRLQLLRGASV